MRRSYIETTNHIFFLQFEEKLPESFFEFSAQFSKWNITLLPVRIEDLKLLADSKRQHILSICPDIASARKMIRFRDSFLDFALTNNKFCLFDVSSFSKFSIDYKLRRHGAYHYFQMPVSLTSIAEKMAVAIYKEKRKNDIWPGGKRATLPPV